MDRRSIIVITMVAAILLNNSVLGFADIFKVTQPTSNGVAFNNTGTVSNASHHLNSPSTNGSSAIAASPTLPLISVGTNVSQHGPDTKSEAFTLTAQFQAIGILFSVISLVIALSAYRISRRTSTLASNEGITKSFDTMCQLALANDAMLKTLDSVFFPEFTNQSIDHIKKRWGTYLVLNTIERTFFAYKTKAIDARTATPILEQMLERLLSDYAAQEAFKSGSYDKDFIAYVSLRTGITHPLFDKISHSTKS